jgi:hypothetical protein
MNREGAKDAKEEKEEEAEGLPCVFFAVRSNN